MPRTSKKQSNAPGNLFNPSGYHEISNQPETLEKKSFFIYGLGHFGETAALCLARIGVQKFILAEAGLYELTEKKYSIGCSEETLGLNKARAVGKQILSIHPKAVIQTITRPVTKEEAVKQALSADITVLDTGNPDLTLKLAEEAHKAGKTLLVFVPSGNQTIIAVLKPAGFTLESIKTHEPLTPADFCPALWSAASTGVWNLIYVLTGMEKEENKNSYWVLEKDRIKMKTIRRPILIRIQNMVQRMVHKFKS